jgi:hypothetical protein
MFLDSRREDKWFWTDHLTLYFIYLMQYYAVSGYRSRGPGFHSRRYQIFWELVGLEGDPLSLVRITEELFEWKK